MTTNWQEIRQQVLERDKYECQRCGLNFPVFDVHHIKRISYYPGLHSLDNLISLCRRCHKIVESNKRKLDKKMARLNFKFLETLIEEHEQREHGSKD